MNGTTTGDEVANTQHYYALRVKEGFEIPHPFIREGKPVRFRKGCFVASFETKPFDTPNLNFAGLYPRYESAIGMRAVYFEKSNHIQNIEVVPVTISVDETEISVHKSANQKMEDRFS